MRHVAAAAGLSCRDLQVYVTFVKVRAGLGPSRLWFWQRTALVWARAPAWLCLHTLLNQSESPVQQPKHLTCLIQMFPLYRAEINTGVQQGLQTAVAEEQQLWSRGLRRCDARRLLQEASPELHQPLVAWRELVQACLQVPITWPLSRAGFMEFPR